MWSMLFIDNDSTYAQLFELTTSLSSAVLSLQHLPGVVLIVVMDSTIAMLFLEVSKPLALTILAL